MSKLFLCVTLGLLVAACGDSANDVGAGDAGDGHSHEGAHGGQVLDLGAGDAHLEVVHDESAGTLVMWVLGADAKSALAIAKPPEVKLVTASGPTVLQTTARDPSEDGKSAVFECEHEGLREHELDARITVTIGEKVYNPKLEHHH